MTDGVDRRYDVAKLLLYAFHRTEQTRGALSVAVSDGHLGEAGKGYGEWSPFAEHPVTPQRLGLPGAVQVQIPVQRSVAERGRA